MLFFMPKSGGADLLHAGDAPPPGPHLDQRLGGWRGITRNVPPTFPGDLTSPAPVNQVLEVPGGFADRHGIKAGDRVRWQ